MCPRCRSLDRELADKTKLKDPSADWSDLRVMRADTMEVPTTSEDMQTNSLSAVEMAQLTAKLNLFKVKLDHERSSWKFHQLAVKKYEDDKHISETQWREAGSTCHSVVCPSTSCLLTHEFTSCVCLSGVPRLAGPGCDGTHEPLLPDGMPRE